VRAFRPEVVVVGVASTEPHGPILPYGSDFFECEYYCRNAVLRANKQGARVLLYPVLPIGNNVNFKAFPFACRMGVRTLMCVILDIVKALEEDGIRKVVLVNGHGGNSAAMAATLREHYDVAPPERRAFCCIVQDWDSSLEAEEMIEFPSSHGGESEVSRNMHAKPEFVHTDKLQDQPAFQPMIDVLNDRNVVMVHPWHRRYPLSGGGDARKATAEKGRALMDSAVDKCVKLLVELSRTPWHPEFPYAPKG
jgi:creatinine amidohydrolase